MRPFARTLLLSVLGVLIVAGPAAAWQIDGNVYCDDGDGVLETNGQDTPRSGVVVKAVADNGMGTTFTDTTSASGFYDIDPLPDEPDTYIVMIQSGLPAGASVIVPVGGSYTVSLTDDNQHKTRNFLLAPCDSSTTSSTTSTSNTTSTSTTTSTSSSSTSCTSSTSTSSTTSTTAPPCEATLDHLKCYRTRRITSFSPKSVSLVDQFETATMNVLRPYRLCNPVDKNDEGINDPTEHQMCYQIRDTVAGPRFRRRDVLVENQFGPQTLVVTRPDTLCVPAEKDGVPSDLDNDRLKCYRVAQKVGERDFVPITVRLKDQFEDKRTVVLKPVLLCNPTGLGADPMNPICHQVCYRITDAEGEAEFIPVPVTVRDEFFGDPMSLDPFRGECRQVSLLCVPSLKTELP